MDITVYLPEALGKKAKEANIKFSRLLREAVEQELAIMEAMQNMETREIKLETEDKEGGPLFVRFEGEPICSVAEISAYRKEDNSIIIYDEALKDYEAFDADDTEAVEEHLAGLLRHGGDEDYVEMLRKLGITPTIDI